MSALRPSFPALPRLRRLALGLVALGALAGCGGGAYYEYSDDGGYYDDPPSVSLAAGTSVAAPGSAVRLVAAATDDYAVHHVSFYIRDARGDILLVEDFAAPWEITTTVPNNAVGTVTYVARAVDDAGQVSRSSLASVTVAGN